MLKNSQKLASVAVGVSALVMGGAAVTTAAAAPADENEQCNTYSYETWCMSSKSKYQESNAPAKTGNKSSGGKAESEIDVYGPDGSNTYWQNTSGKSRTVSKDGKSHVEIRRTEETYGSTNWGGYECTTETRSITVKGDSKKYDREQTGTC